MMIAPMTMPANIEPTAAPAMIPADPPMEEGGRPVGQAVALELFSVSTVVVEAIGVGTMVVSAPKVGNGVSAPKVGNEGVGNRGSDGSGPSAAELDI